jgi:hypothetical protein
MRQSQSQSQRQRQTTQSQSQSQSQSQRQLGEGGTDGPVGRNRRANSANGASSCGAVESEALASNSPWQVRRISDISTTAMEKRQRACARGLPGGIHNWQESSSSSRVCREA